MMKRCQPTDTEIVIPLSFLELKGLIISKGSVA